MENIKLKTILKNGDIVRVRKIEEKKWNTNVIFEVMDGQITLDAGMNEEYYKLTKIGDKLNLKFTTDEFEYTMNAVVVGMGDRPIQTMTLKIDEVKSHVNTRKDMRHFVYLFALIKDNKDDKDPIFSVITDISKSGVAASINDKSSMKKSNISLDDRLYFEVSLEDQRKIEFEGIIRREKKSKTSLDYGVQISVIDDYNKKILNDYVDELKNMDDEFQQLKQEIWDYNFSM